MKKNNLLPVIYAAVCIILCAIPFVGMTVSRTETTTENRTLAAAPSLTKEDGGFNKEFLSDAGAYFEDHFAFRTQMVSADAKLMNDVFGKSSADSVLAGKNGWLYYTSTLDDYLGRKVLSSRGIWAMIHNLELIRTYVESKGVEFAVTIPPNKNTLYDENMPDSEKSKIRKLSNLDLLTYALEHSGSSLNYVDLEALFTEYDEQHKGEENASPLYYLRDSHWNNTGALLAYNALLDAIGKKHETYAENAPVVTEDYIGDLNGMLYPEGAVPETCIDYQIGLNYTFTSGEEDVTAGYITTENPQAKGKLLMYRDSFTNTLLPLMANAYKEGVFQKAVPYDIGSQLEEKKYNAVLIELVERNISQFVTDPAVIPAMETTVSAELTRAESDTTFTLKESETQMDYWQLSGEISGLELSDEAEILVQIGTGDEAKFYSAYSTVSEDCDTGFCLYSRKGTIGDGEIDVQIIVHDGAAYTIVASGMVSTQTPAESEDVMQIFTGSAEEAAETAAGTEVAPDAAENAGDETQMPDSQAETTAGESAKEGE